MHFIISGLMYFYRRSRPGRGSFYLKGQYYLNLFHRGGSVDGYDRLDLVGVKVMPKLIGSQGTEELRFSRQIVIETFVGAL